MSMPSGRWQNPAPWDLSRTAPQRRGQRVQIMLPPPHPCRFRKDCRTNYAERDNRRTADDCGDNGHYQSNDGCTDNDEACHHHYHNVENHLNNHHNHDYHYDDHHNHNDYAGHYKSNDRSNDNSASCYDNRGRGTGIR